MPLVNSLVQDSYAPRTLLNYARVWRRFQEFLSSLALPSTLPVPRDSIALYLAALSREGRGPSTIRGTLTAIGWKHKIAGVRDPSGDFLLSRMIKGIRRARPHPPNRVLPVTVDILHRILGVIPGVTGAPYEAALMGALFLLAYYGAFRVGELAKSGTLAHTIKLEHVVLGRGKGGDSVELTLPSFKFSKGEVSLLLSPVPASPFCPVRALSLYLSLRPSGPGPLFISKSGAPITRARLLRC